jgi:hypothetical protein
MAQKVLLEGLPIIIFLNCQIKNQSKWLGEYLMPLVWVTNCFQVRNVFVGDLAHQVESFFFTCNLVTSFFHDVVNVGFVQQFKLF